MRTMHVEAVAVYAISSFGETLGFVKHRADGVHVAPVVSGCG